MNESKIEFYLPEELIHSLEKYADESKSSKEDILRKALYEFFVSHPIERWNKKEFEDLARLSRKRIQEEKKK